jgi:pSer/pThr/pTyr-binding forkhead associated (FHA) protein
VTSCAFCGRENDAASRFCIDCGKPMNPSAVRVGPAYVPHPSGGSPQPVSAPAAAPRPSFDIMPGNGPVVPATRVSEAICPRCRNVVTAGLPFCGHCGQRVGQRVSVEVATPASATQVIGAGRMAAGPKLALLGDAGEILEQYTIERGEAVVGRGDADIRFESDTFMSPIHARLELRDGKLWLRDLGSRNGSWAFIDEPTKLTDGDLILIGSQLLRFRRLGYPGPNPPEADSTRRMGSTVPTVDIAVIEQLRADGSCRDVYHLSPARTVAIGREAGDWVFPYDPTMSGRHAEIRSEDSEFFVHDTHSRNGVAMSVRGERALSCGQRLLIGDQILRVESV